MKTISPALAAHMASGNTTLATLVKLTLTDNTVMGFTDHDKNLTVGGLLYEAAKGQTPSALSQSSDLAVDNMNVVAMLDSASITEEDIHAGRYDFARVDVYLVNWADVSMGVMQQNRGTFGEVMVSNGQLTVEFEARGLTQQLQQTIGRVHNPACDADLGDSRCKVALGGFTHAGSVTSVSSQRVLTDSALVQVDGYFNSGVITWLTGNNAGLEMEIKKSTAAGVVELFLPMPKTISVGDTFSARAGCDKLLSTCKAKFNNVINFRGFPHIPGTDKMLEYP